MKESLGEMMARVQAGMPSGHWKNTSVGVVNFRNKAAAERAAIRLVKIRAEKDKGAKK